ncbi:unnamed protein product, partial [Adineta steineri]
PSSIAVSDFNNDKQLDIAIAQYGTDNIGILLGYQHPDARRQKAVILGSELHPCLIALADVNNDNLLDIVVINVTARSINIFLRFDNGRFSNAISSATGNGSLIQSFSIGDFNNDNRLDIVAINIDGTDIEIFLGCGNGSFAEQSTYPILNPYGSQWIAVGDFNNDNRTDIVVSNSFSHNIYVFLANANGTFSNPVEYSNGDEFLPNAITVNDFNNDKQLDILVVNDYPDHRQLEIFLSYSDGMFTNKTIYTIPLRTDYSVTLLAVADFNNDNQQDIVVCYSRTDLIGIFISNGLGRFASEKIYSFETNSNPQSLLIGDLNNDKRLDIIVALTYTNKVGIFLGFGDGVFELVRHYSTGDKSGPFSIGAADLNNDHVLDIVVSNAISGSIDIFFGFYREIFFRHLVYATGKGSASHSVAIGDFNNDSRQDIVVTNSGNDNIGVFFGYGNGKFQNQTTYLTGIGSRPQSVAVGDFNNDNYLDIVVANYGNESIGIFLGFINGSFSNQIKYSIGFGSRPSSIIVFDFNKDYQLDIVITDDGTSNVIMLVGFGNGSFGLLTKYRTGYNSQPCALAIADFNNDFETDITIANCDVYQIYDSFSKLNKRFENLLLYSTFPLKMNIPSLSKSTFERYYNEIIMSNKHRIRSLHLSDPFTIELFFYINDNISIYSKLETLILPYVDSQYLKNLLQRLASLPKLSSLSIFIGDELYKEYIYHLIFQLPVLKSCKISLHKDTYFTSIPRCTVTPSPIENLIINGRCDYNAFDAILSYVPQLRCLSINNLCRFTNQGTSLFKTILHKLTNVSLTMNHIHFDHIEPLFKKSFNHVKILQISSSGDRTYLLDADRWERLIVSYMPYLHIFNFEHKSKILSYDVDENIYQPLLDKFSSPFWCQRQWFFTHESNCEVHSHGIFYSTGPYR